MEEKVKLPDAKYRLFIYSIVGPKGEDREAYISYFCGEKHIRGMHLSLKFFRQYFKHRRENWFFDGFFDLTLIDNGTKISLDQVDYSELSDLNRKERSRCYWSRCHRKNLYKGPFIAQILSEEYGPVDAFMEKEGLTFEPGKCSRKNI